MDFVKMHACGNDYVYVDYQKVKNYDLSLLAKAVSNRNFFIGSDGLITVEKISEDCIKMNIINSDGSVGATCGNGVRCSALFARNYLGVKKENIFVKTNSSTVLVNLVKSGDDFLATANMSVVKTYKKSKYIAKELQKVGLYVDYRQVYLVDAGNLHLVFFFPNHSLLSLEKGVRKSKLFCNGINIERVYKVAQGENLPTLYTEICERGSGKTLSCGSGACAVANAFIPFSHTEKRAFLVKTEGGTLEINLKNKDTLLSGRVYQVFNGQLCDHLLLEFKLGL